MISPIRAYEDRVLSKMSLPKLSDIPEYAGFYAYQCCTGNWLEAFQIGYWDKVYDYDMNSAYPAQLRNLVDLRNGSWIQSDKYVPEALYGYCNGVVNMSAKFHPVVFRVGDRNELPSNYTPTGSWETCLNKGLIDYIVKRNLGSYEIKDGWWWIPKGELVFLFRKIIDGLYLAKESASDNYIKKEQIKRIMSGIYGKLLEGRNNEFGEMFNPVYGAEVEIGTRIEVSEFVVKNKLDVVHIAVDGVVSSNEAKVESNGIGSWRLSNTSPCICAGTGSVALMDDITGDFHLSYLRLEELIKNNPMAKEYKFAKKVPVTVAESINGYWDKLGSLREIFKYVNIGEVDKRCYKEKPHNGKELLARSYQSEPWDVSLISNKDNI